MSLFCKSYRDLLYVGCRYMVDAADQEKVEASRNELHNLLDKPQLQGIPVSPKSFSNFPGRREMNCVK